MMASIKTHQKNFVVLLSFSIMVVTTLHSTPINCQAGNDILEEATRLSTLVKCQQNVKNFKEIVR